jgi:hypothetical protein
MKITHAALALLLAGPASAQTYAQQQALKLDADLVRTMTDAVFLSLTGRAVADEAPAAPDETASADGPDSRLSRPRALSMMYETLASYEYAQADAGGKPQEAGVKLSTRHSSLADPKSRKAAASLSRIRSRLHASKAAPVESGRSVSVGNKRLAALNKTVGDLNAQLQDPAATPAAKAALHAKLGKVYDQMSAAARYQASVSVVTGSVLDDADAASVPAAPADPSSDSNQIARKSAKAAKPAAKSAVKAKIADDAAPAATDAPAPSDDDAAAAGTSDLNDMSSKMHDRIQSTKFEDPKQK